MSGKYEPTGYCPRCDYRLDSAPCPECGATFARPARLSAHSRRVRMRRIALRVFVLALCAAGLWFAVPAAVYRYWPQSHLLSLAAGHGRLADFAGRILSWRNQRAMSRARRQLARAQVETNTAGVHPWAGDYSSPMETRPDPGTLVFKRHQTLFALAPGAGFAYIEEIDSIVQGVRLGTVEELAPGHLRLIDQTGDVQIASRPLPDEWYVVSWGPTTLLVPASRMRKFTVESNSGDSKEGHVRTGVPPPGWPFSDTRPTVPPTVPPEYRRLLLSTPIECTLTALDAPTSQPDPKFPGMISCSAIGTVDAGAQQGLLPGLALYATTKPLAQVDTLVTSVSESTASVRVRWHASKYQPSPPRAGCRFSTRKPFEPPVQ